MISRDEDESSFKGKYYSIIKARCKPISRCRNHGHVYGLAEEVRRLSNWYRMHGDGCIYGLCTYDTYVRKISILNEHCSSINRDYREVIKAWHGVMFIANDTYEQRRK